MEKAREFQKKKSISALLTMPNLCVDHNKQWKILKEMGIPDHLSCLLKNLYAATVTTGHGKTDWFLIGKKYVKAVYCHPLF